MSEVSRKMRGTAARLGVLLAAHRQLPLPPPPRDVVHEGVDAVFGAFEADRARPPNLHERRHP